MDFVGDYQTKKKMAAALRARETSMQKAVSGIDIGPIVTQGQGAAPTQVQANWAAPLAQMGAAYFANKAGKKAEAAETESASARMQALQGLMGSDVGPEQLLQMEQLDVNPAMAKLMLPEKMNMAAIAQASGTPAGIRALVQMKVLSEEEGAQRIAALDTDRAAATEREKDMLKYKAGLEPAPYHAPDADAWDFGQWQKDHPQGTFTQYKEWMAGLSGKGGRGGKAGKATPEESRQKMIGLLEEMEKTANDPNLSSLGNKIGGVLSQYDSPLAKAGGSMLENAAGIKMRSLQLDAALEEAGKLTPVSNTDFRALMSRYQSATTNPNEFKIFVKQYREFLEKYGDGKASPNADEYSPNGVDPETGIVEDDANWSVKVKGAP